MAAKKTTISAEMFYQYATAIATTTTTTPATAGTHLVESSSSSSPSAANVTLHARITLIAYCYILPMICVIGIIGMFSLKKVHILLVAVYNDIL